MKNLDPKAEFMFSFCYITIMEIIKHGITYKTPQIKVCPVCECEFSYEEKDIKQNWVRVTSEDSDLTYTYVNCPECGKTIIIKDFRK